MLRQTLFAIATITISCFCAGAVTLSVAAPAANAATEKAADKVAAPSSAELVNESGRLRMLAERMGKAYAQIALNVMPDKAREQIAQSQKRFEDNLQFVGRGTGTPELKSMLYAVTISYRSYALALAVPPTKATVPLAHRQTDQVVADADRLTTALSAQSNAPTAKIVNVSGRQRMLAQRMARLYFAAALNGNNKSEIEKYRIEFKNALATLEGAPLSSPEIKRELELAKTQWLFFDQALQGIGDTASNIRNVATTSERLLETMDNLTAMYSNAMKYMVGESGLPAWIDSGIA